MVKSKNKGKGKKKGGVKNANGSVDRRIDLPAEVIAIIARHLLDANAYRTCAAVNVLNTAVYNETLPDLWRQLVLWPAKIYAEAPESFWASDEFHRKPSEAEKARERKVLELYEEMKSAPGAAYSEWIVVPPFILSSKPKHKQIKRHAPSPTTLFPRAKVNISLMTMPSNNPRERAERYVFLTLLDYVYGSDDLYQLSAALLDFYKAGGPHVKRAFAHPKGVYLLPWKAPKATLKEVIARRKAIPPRWAFRPLRFNIMTHPSASGDAFVHGFLEAVEWLTPDREKKDRDGRRFVTTLPVDMEAAAACVKWYQKAVQGEPAYAFVNLQFNIAGKSPINSNLEGMQSIIAIIRGTYLLASETIKLRDIGDFLINVEEPGGTCIRAEVRPIPQEGVIETTLSAMGVRRVLHRDVCKPIDEGDAEDEMSKFMRGLYTV